MLRIQLFGSFQVIDAEKPLARLQSERLQALLAYLVLHRDQSLARQQLAVAFWPDTTDAQARTNLRTLISRLREAFPDANQFLAIDAQTVQWRSDSPGAIDVIEFEQAVASGALAHAVELYRGDLLPGCYDDWIAGERERLKQEFCAVLERLILHLANLGDYRSAIRYTEHLLQSDPLREETYRRLIRLYALSGDRTGVVHVYQTCVRVLKRELDVEPSSETRAVYDESRRTSAPLVHSAIPAERRTNNLPAYLTSFIGRKEELERLTQLFSRHDVSTVRTRLITLTGAGGGGKTRLAIELARQLAETSPDGVWFVDLAPLTSPLLIPQAIATVLDVQEQAGRALLDTLTDYLQSKALLLILDNCEHVVAACAQVVRSLLSACAHLRVLATSTEKLNVMGEMAWLVSSLSLPDVNDQTPGIAPRSDAVHLFVERACSALPTFTLNKDNAAAIVQICQHLDGIPLAIELAAARISMLTPAQIATRLDNAFQLLTRGSYTTRPHHETLRATMDWSYQLLSEKERILFRRLAVFAGGFTLEAVEQVCTDQVEPVDIPHSAVVDLLSRLIDKSLVMAMELELDQMRYRLLEPTWQYAKEKLLEFHEFERLQSCHLEFFLNLAEEAEPHFSQADQGAWYDRLTAESDNLRAAINWSLKRGEATAALRLTRALHDFWSARGHYQEGVGLLMQALAQSDAAIPSGARANALQAAGALLLWSDSNWSQARPLLEQALAIGRKLADKKIVAASLSVLGAAACGQKEFAAAQAFLDECLVLRRELGDKHGLGWSLAYLGDVALLQRDDAQAWKRYEESADCFREIGDSNSLAYPFRRLGGIALYRGDYQQAITQFQESLTRNYEVSNPKGVAACLVAFAALAVKRRQLIRAAKLFGAGEVILSATAGELFTTDQIEFDVNVAALRAHLEESSLDAAWAEGRAMTMPQAIGYALESEEH